LEPKYAQRHPIGARQETRMIRTASAALILSLAVAGAAQANPTSRDPAKVPAGTYVLDKEHASLIAKIPHLGGFSRFTLRFDRLDGSFAYDPANWQATKIRFTVDPSSVDTGAPAFNKQIAGYFDVAKYPSISFVSTGIAGGENGQGTVTGDLTFHGVTKPVTLNVTFNGVGPGILGVGTRAGFSGTTRINRTEFGESAVRQWAGDDVDLIFELEFAKK
jgi:polyisoprenoid-binding protein YceI